MAKLSKKEKAEQRAKKIETAIRLAYDSLQSHLPYTYGKDLNDGETHLFHQRCCKEYSTIIKILTELY